ncbi:MAG: Ig-like domain-containing protein, partial [Planctomycetota bacterium]
MSVRRSPSLGSLAGKLQRLLKGSNRKKQLRRKSRRQFFEQLERRDLMALNIVSVSPLDGATEVPVDTNLVVTFNENVVKGQGNIYILRKSTNAVGLAIDVRSPSVTVSGAQVTIDPPSNLLIDNSYYVLIDNGAFIDSSSTPTANATILTQNFDYLALGPQVFETTGNGVTDWTATPPDGFTTQLDNAAMTGVGITEWRGWTFPRKEFWITAAGQDRNLFNNANGNIAVGDSDEYDDGNSPVRPFQSTLKTKAVDLTGVAANSVKLEFDSSFRPEDSQIGRLSVSYDGGTTFTQLLELNPSNTDNDAPYARGNLNEKLTTGGVTGGGAAIGSVNNPTGGSLVFSFYTEGGNDFWWAIDNLKITGDIVGVPFGGVSDPLFWEFTTPVPLGFAVTFDKGYISENGGTAVGTVTRTAQNITGDIVVTLTSSDTTEATVPATITIPSGVRSLTFPVTAVDDTLFDRTQGVSISASATNYTSAAGTIRVTDDEGPDVVSVVPADNATDAYYRTNLIVNFNTNVKKGSGRLHIVETSTGVLGETIDINSANVTISGSKVTINPTADLKFQTNYHVLFDDGAILDTSSTLVPSMLLLSETFDLLPLGPFVNETGGDGTDFTFTPPLGYSVDNSLMPTGSTSEFRGWSFMDKNSWIAASNDGSGNVFTRGSGTVAVADPDEFFDRPSDPGQFTTFLVTAPINLTGVSAGTVSIEFDSSFRRSGSGYGQMQISYDNGSTWTDALFFGDEFNPNDGRNERIVYTSANTFGQYIGAATVDSVLSNPSSGQLRLRFSIQNATNANMWWAIDNLAIRGQVTGEPYAGIEDPTAWNFRTGILPVLTVSVSPGSISENGGVATGTVTRSQTDQGDLVVTLTSNDLTEATVPATVTIPDGAFSATFPITAVDDSLLEFPQTVTITATASDFTTGSAQIVVADDDFGIIGVSPLPGSTNVPVDTNFAVVFNQPIRKGNGYIHLVRQSDGKSELSVNVNSPAVTIVNDTMFIDLPSNLKGQTAFYGLLDPGAVLTTLAQATVGSTLLAQNFELLTLKPAVLEEVGVTLDGKDFTATPPQDWSVNNSSMPPGGAPEWTGWTFANKGFWQNQGGQGRANFTRGQGTIAIGDTDEWDDYARPTNNFNSLYSSNAIDLDAVEANSVVLEFDSSFRPEGTTPNPNNQIGTVQVSYDDGASWSDLLVLDVNNTNGSATATNVNERRSITVNNPDTGLMKFRWALTGTNDWWWAIDNIVVTGTTVNFPSPALSDPAVYTITTAEASTLTVDAPASATETAGTVSATVSRNLGTVGDVIVTLASSNTAVGTVPATVTIPAGQPSATFAITILDDAFFDGSQPLKITASASGFVSGEDIMTVTDDETGSVLISEIMYNPQGGATQEQRNEWVEIFNNGTTTVDLSGWRLNDEDKQDWGRIASGSLLLPGEVAVLYNSLYGLNTDTLFRTDWKVPASAKVFGVAWSMEDDGSNKQRGGLFNSPAIGQEVLTLQDPSNNNIDLVDFARDGGWPASPESASIYVVNPAADNNVGTNWLAAVAGIDGAVRASGSVFNNNDRGSPGRVTDNDVPAVTVSAATVSGNVLSVITNTGTWSDPNAGDTVTLTATLGSVVRNGDGTWSWSFTPSTVLTNQSVTITATDAGGLSSQVSFTVSSLVAVLNSKVYYKGSSFAGTSVDAALDTSKVIAKSGATAQALTFANLINTTRGINGLVFDVGGLTAASLTASDFVFRMSPTGAFNEATNPPSSWAAAPAPSLVNVTAGTATTAARVRLEWADNAIADRWLQVKVLANANTGLLSPEVFYVGHLYGEVNGSTSGGLFSVSIGDATAIRP